MDRPVLLDLGAVAKGLAADLAVAELTAVPGAVVDLGGDCRIAGSAPGRRGWPVVIADPHRPGRCLPGPRITDRAVATSGGYRRRDLAGRSHIRPDGDLASATVIAPSALMADGLATAACLLPRPDALALLAACPDVEGLLVSDDGSVHTTDGWLTS
ncbi:MAG TPA: FAD:protein FMN transferase [Pseudonocardiaceae bacterium]